MHGTFRKCAMALVVFCSGLGSQHYHADQDEEREDCFETRVRKAVTAYVEERLSKWKPVRDNSRQPNKRIVAADLDIKGNWIAGGGYSCSTLSISGTGDRVSVSFYTTGCLNQWELERTAVFADGILLFNRPVEEYIGLTYKKLYAVRIDGQEFLVSSPAVELVEKALSEDFTTVRDKHRLEMLTFRREEAQSVTEVSRD